MHLPLAVVKCTCLKHESKLLKAVTSIGDLQITKEYNDYSQEAAQETAGQ